MFFNKSANSAQVLGTEVKETRNDDFTTTKVFINTNVPYGYQKREAEISIKLVNEHIIDNYGQTEEVQRRFTLDFIYDSKFKQTVLFHNTVKPLIDSAFDNGYQHTILLYAPQTLSYYEDLLGLRESRPQEECQLFYALRYVIELSEFKSDIQSPIQVSMVALRNDEVIDLFNQGKPLESPLGYTLDSIEHIENFLDYSRNLLLEAPKLEHLCISIYYQNKKILPGDQVETRDACLNFLLLRGDRAINLAAFLNQDKDRMNESTMNNHVEKLLLHFLSSNYDAENLPYGELPLAFFLKKYLPYSYRKDIAFFVDMEKKPIEVAANDLLYAELCQEVAEVPKEEDSEDNEPSVYESRILQNLSLTHERIRQEYEDLQRKKSNFEESVLKLESASTAGTNPMHQIQKFSLNSQYERFLHEMNSKLKALVSASNNLMSDVNAVVDFSRSEMSPGTLTPKAPRGHYQPSNYNRAQGDKNDGMPQSYTKENTMIVKDVQQKYPSIMVQEGSEYSMERGPDSPFKQPTQPLDRTLMGQIDKLQKDLKMNLDCFMNNFDLLKQQLKMLQGSPGKQKFENFMPRLMEMKDFADRHNLKNLSLPSQLHLHGKSATIYREPGLSKDIQYYLNKRHMSSVSDSTSVKKASNNINNSRSSAYQVDDFRSGLSMTPKKAMAGLGRTGLAEIKEKAYGKSDAASGGTSRKDFATPKKLDNEKYKQDMLGITWKKLFAFSMKEVHTAMNGIFVEFIKEEPAGALCSNPKSKQKVNPTEKQQDMHAKGPMLSTLEEFRTTYERFETENQQPGSYGQKLQDCKSFDEDDQGVFEEKDTQTKKRPSPSQFFANASIDTIKPIGNRQSFSQNNQESSPFWMKLSRTLSGVGPQDKKSEGPGNQTRSDYANTGRRDALARSILHKLEELDIEDAKTKVIRRLKLS